MSEHPNSSDSNPDESDAAPRTRPEAPRRMTDQEQALQDLASVTASRAEGVASVPSKTLAPNTTSRSIQRRQTLVPLLLTTSVLLIAIGCGWFATAPDSTWRRFSSGAAWSLIIAGTLMLLVSLLNVLRLKHDLDALHRVAAQR